MDELSKKTLGSYMDKAQADKKAAAKASVSPDRKPGDYTSSQRAIKRDLGMRVAKDRLAKE